MSYKELWIALIGLLTKEVNRFMRGWPQTFFPSLVTTVLYFLVFGEVMGQRIGTVMGLSYIVFITPGLVMLAVLNNSYSNVVSSFFGVRFTRAVEEILASPMPNWLVIVGYVGGGVVRGLLVGILVLLISLAFAQFVWVHVILSLMLIILCSTLFSLLGLLNAIFARKFDDLVLIPAFILTPLIYVGGVFFNITELSPTWQFVAHCNPVYYLIETFRYALLGVQSSMGSIVFAIFAVIGFTIFFFIVTLVLMNKGVRLKS